MSVLSQPSKTS